MCHRGRLFLQILEVVPTEPASHGIQVEGHIIPPIRLERRQQKGPHRTYFRAGRPLLFPYLDEQDIGRGQTFDLRVPPRTGSEHRDPAPANLLAASVLDEGQAVLTDGDVLDHLLVAQLRVEEQFHLADSLEAPGRTIAYLFAPIAPALMIAVLMHFPAMTMIIKLVK